MRPSVGQPNGIGASQPASKGKSTVRALVQSLVNAARERRDLRLEANVSAGDPRRGRRPLA